MFKNIRNYKDFSNSNNIKIGLFIMESSVSSDIRLLSPLNSLSNNKQYETYVILKSDFENVKQDLLNNTFAMDFIIIQRNAIDLNFFKLLFNKSKQLNFKIIYEIDDDLLNMDESNPGYPYYMKIKPDLEYMIKNSDIVTVSTQNLKESLINLNNNIIIIPNRLIEIWEEETFNNSDKPSDIIKIGYMGTIYHGWDLKLLEQPINNVKNYFLNKNKKVIFEVIGGTEESFPWINRIEVPEESASYVNFIRWFKKTADWDIVVAPLEDSNLNKSKSALKYLEYSGLGVPGVYSAIDPYKENIIHGITGLLINTNSSEEWERNIIRLIEDDSLRECILKNAQEDIRNNFLIKDTIKQWADIFKCYSFGSKNKYYSEQKYLSLSNENQYLKKKVEIAEKNITVLENHIKNQSKNNISLNNINVTNKDSEVFPKLKNIKIAYVLEQFPTLSQTFVLNELRWLVNNGYNVKVFYYEDPEKAVDLDFNLEFIRFDISSNLMENLERLIHDYEIDLIHTHFVWPTVTKFTFPIAQKLDLPFTFFAHAFDIFKEFTDKHNNIGEITNSKQCKGVFTLSNYHKNYLMERNVPEDKIIITRQATDYEIHELKEKKNKIKKIISISRFVEKKGIDLLIDCAKLLQDEDLEFSIYGFGPLKEKLEKQIKDLNLNNVSIKGVLNGHKEVQKVFDESDLLISPCRIAKDGDRDGIPTIMFESMAYGVPVITTDVSAIPEIIENGKNGFIFKENDVNDLADKIKHVCQLSSSDLFEIRKKAQLDVQKYSSVSKTMKNVLNTWNELF